MDDFRFLPAADSALVIEFGSAIDRGTSDRVLALAEALTRAALPGATEIVATFRSLCVNYDSLLTTGRELEAAIRALVRRSGASAQVRRLWDIPVCYDVKFAPDIEDVARSVDLTVGEVRGGHDDGVRIERLEQLGVRRGDGQSRGAPRLLGHLGRGLREGNDGDVRLPLESLGEQPPAQSRADDTDSDHDKPFA